MSEVKMSGNDTKSFFSLEKPKEELEGWSDHIVNVMERDYMDGYLKGGWRMRLLPSTVYGRLGTVSRLIRNEL